MRWQPLTSHVNYCESRVRLVRLNVHSLSSQFIVGAGERWSEDAPPGQRRRRNDANLAAVWWGGPSPCSEFTRVSKLLVCDSCQRLLPPSHSVRGSSHPPPDFPLEHVDGPGRRCAREESSAAANGWKVSLTEVVLSDTKDVGKETEKREKVIRQETEIKEESCSLTIWRT